MAKNNKVISNPNKARVMITEKREKETRQLFKAAIRKPIEGTDTVHIPKQQEIVETTVEQMIEQYKNNPKEWGMFMNWVLGFGPQFWLHPEQYEDYQQLLLWGVVENTETHTWSFRKACAIAHRAGWAEGYAESLLTLAHYPKNIWDINSELKAIKNLWGFDAPSISAKKKGGIEFISYQMTHNLWTKMALEAFPSEGDDNGQWAYRTLIAHFNKVRWEEKDKKNFLFDGVNYSTSDEVIMVNV